MRNPLFNQLRENTPGNPRTTGPVLKNAAPFRNLVFILIYIGVTCSGLRAQEFDLSITGSDSTETHIIDAVGYQKKLSSFKDIKIETDSLLLKLQKTGFIDAEHDTVRRKNDSLFTVHFRLKKRYSFLKIYYPKGLFKPKRLKRMTENHTPDYFVIPIRETERVLHRLNSILANRGKPFNRLRLSNIRKTGSDTLSARLKNTDAKLRTIDSIVVRGYEKFPKAYFKNYIGIKKGQVFSKDKIDKKSEGLNNLNFAKQVKPPEVLFTTAKTTLYFYLEKQNSNRFEGFLGFSTDEDSKKLRLDGNISLSLVNNLNHGEALKIHYKNNGEEQQHFNANLKLPFLFSTPFGIDLELDLFRQDTTYTTNTQQAKLTYQMNPHLQLNAGYKSANSNYLLDNSIVMGGNANEDYSADFFMVGGNYRIRNSENMLFPVTSAFDLNLGMGKRRRIQSSDRQYYFEFSGQQIFEIDQRNSIFVANQTSALFSDDYVNNELYKFGGINSLRGFEENSLRASFFSAFQTEYRFLLSATLYIHSIFDYGFMENNLNFQKDNLYGIGFGLGLKTKAGLLRIAFANGKSDGKSFQFKNTKVHLSLTAFF